MSKLKLVLAALTLLTFISCKKTDAVVTLTEEECIACLTEMYVSANGDAGITESGMFEIR